MKRLPRRDKMKIYGDLLSYIYHEGKDGKIVLTHIQLKMNVPFDRLKSYISDLEELRLIEEKEPLTLTEKGKQYLREYEMILDFMKRMGLAYA